ncbi:MAG: ATP-binding protein [Halobacteriota archaeon]|nr:ATP-binding protein [Halobacteriota archaeon]
MAKFKTRARTLDMLGRQQIAGIPTAISELFKNAHDAYADNVEVDYYRSDGLFVLRDDGLGMTKKDFEGRWLTIGTESKLDLGRGLSLPPKDPDKSERSILGEKGIGRLSIASIGPQVLVLTRAKFPDESDDLVAAFINWGLFELPGLDLDQVSIPLRTFPGGDLPRKQDIKEMVKEVIINVETLKNKGDISAEDADKLLKELRKFDVDTQQIDKYLNEPSLTGKGHGTHFIILPADDLLKLSIDGDEKGDKATPLMKALIGFTNTMTPDAPPPEIRASFRDHKTDEFYEDLISGSVFFTPEEFEMADHHFKGEFDEYGQFNGTVTVYGEETSEHVVPWSGAKGKKTLCGPFKINVAYVQGSRSHTKIPPEEHALIMNKLNILGGLYIYKNGVRILPYGDSDYDFLDIEKRRTLKASYYFFSYRRMFGVLEISRENNPNLIEKAGREGFIENKAYRQFKEISENFFLQLAGDFFRTEGASPQAQFWSDRKSELERTFKAMEEREKKAKWKKKKFGDDLNKFFEMVGTDEPNIGCKRILQDLEREIEVASNINDPDESAQAFLNAESTARKELKNLRDTFKIVRPRGFATGKKLQFDYEAYLQKAEEIEYHFFAPTAEKIEEKVSIAETKYHFAVDRRRRVEKALDELIEDTKKATNSETRETRKILDEVRNNVIELTREVLEGLEKNVNEVMSELASTDVSQMNDSALVSERTKLESKILSEAEQNKDILENIRIQLESITWTEDGITQSDIMDSLDEELLALQEKADLDLELSQLGMAVGIIHHEFSGTVKSIRESIRRLKAWADVNEELNPLYNNIRANFEHLDGYLTLFTPLSRRLYRKEVKITGITIKQFLEDLFAERLRRHDITLESTQVFLKKTIVGYPSTFYPVFVNIIDNAIFWVKDSPLPRKIVIDADDKGFSISNNGPEISIRDREIIFEFGFTRKPLGKGLGLHISREVLSKVGYRIFVAEPQLGKGVTFRIEEIQEEKITRDE